MARNAAVAPRQNRATVRKHIRHIVTRHPLVGKSVKTRYEDEKGHYKTSKLIKNAHKVSTYGSQVHYAWWPVLRQSRCIGSVFGDDE